MESTAGKPATSTTGSARTSPSWHKAVRTPFASPSHGAASSRKAAERLTKKASRFTTSSLTAASSTAWSPTSRSSSTTYRTPSPVRAVGPTLPPQMPSANMPAYASSASVTEFSFGPPWTSPSTIATAPTSLAYIRPAISWTCNRSCSGNTCRCSAAQRPLRSITKWGFPELLASSTTIATSR